MPIVVDPSFTPPPPPATITSSDGILTATLDEPHAGCLLRADFSALSPTPVKVRFYRGTDLVRSGDPAWAPGGIAVAYDHEAPLGNVSSWTAVPIFDDGTAGDPSTVAALTVPEMTDPSTAWVKPLADPDLSMLVRVARAEEGGRDLSTTLAGVPGSPYPVGSWDVTSSLQLTLTLRTDTQDEYDALVSALSAGPVLVQSSSQAGVPQNIYALPVGTLAAVHLQGTETGFGWAYRAWAITLTEIARPVTLDAPLVIPGNSWVDVATSYASWDDLVAQVPSWTTLLGA